MRYVGWTEADDQEKPAREAGETMGYSDQNERPTDGYGTIDEQNDELELALAASRGNEEAFLRRTDMEKEKLYAIAYSYMRSEGDALEMVQEAVCRAWQKRRSLREPRYYSTWLVRILIRICMDSSRKRKRELPLGDRTAAKSQSYGMDPAGMLTDRMVIEKALDQLNEQERMVVVLKYYRDLTLSDIAMLLEKPLGTVKTRLHKALVKLRIELDEDGKEEGGFHEKSQRSRKR
ncbi:sigma-70 family RNA polymerase sigma factor [Paenibacillus kobensis]|uniref:sigma-70 family RNA polymerase sigma factor n=1 Tax=Paenibacillus kobensis TaxID=59841 RepID=UPI001FEC54BC|nr:sigma-70 family RNA polymerase sigma factor [Paenibacillus kobensis]